MLPTPKIIREVTKFLPSLLLILVTNSVPFQIGYSLQAFASPSYKSSYYSLQMNCKPQICVIYNYYISFWLSVGSFVINPTKLKCLLSCLIQLLWLASKFVLPQQLIYNKLNIYTWICPKQIQKLGCNLCTICLPIFINPTISMIWIECLDMKRQLVLRSTSMNSIFTSCSSIFASNSSLLIFQSL